MPTATPSKPAPRRPGPSESVVAVLGERNRIARKLETALEPHHVRFEYHDSPLDLLETAMRAHAAAPADVWKPAILYLFNFLSERAEPRAGKQWSAWLDALHKLNEDDPSAPILITADQHAQRALIIKALEAGAKEFIGADEAAIERLVLLRVQSAFAAAAHNVATWVHPGIGRALEVSTAEPATPALSPARRATEGDRDEPEEALSPAGRERALARLGHAVDQLPEPRSRRGPYVDLLGISVPELRAKSGRLDAKRIAERFHLSLRELARALPVTHQALSETPDSPKVQEALDPFARTAAILGELLPGEQGPQWLNTPRARLQNRTPLQALVEGQGERVARMLERVRDGGGGG